MIWFFWHLFTGAQYRAELVLRYRSDVCDKGSVTDLHLSARKFDTGLFDCLEGDMFLRRNFYACCCAPVLFAVDAAAVGLMGFWLALVLASLFLPFIWIMGFVARVRMRRVFSMKRRFIMDFLAWFFCHWCALVQEHKFMERVFEAKRRGERNVEICPRMRMASPVTNT